MLTHNQTNTISLQEEESTTSVGRVRPEEIATALGRDAPNPLQSLLTQAHRTTYAQHAALYHQGSSSDTVFFVTEGLLKLIIHLPNGRARIVRLHRPGSVLGLSGLLGKDNEHTAVAITPVTTLRLPIGALQRLRTEDPTTYVTLSERWHEYLQEADTWIADFSTGPIRGRVARLLTFLSEFERGAAEGEVHLLTCEEMGSILGVTTESASRTLAEFKRADILIDEDSESNERYQVDIDRLQNIGHEE